MKKSVDCLWDESPLERARDLNTIYYYHPTFTGHVSNRLDCVWQTLVSFSGLLQNCFNEKCQYLNATVFCKCFLFFWNGSKAEVHNSGASPVQRAGERSSLPMEIEKA